MFLGMVFMYCPKEFLEAYLLHDKWIFNIGKGKKKSQGDNCGEKGVWAFICWGVVMQKSIVANSGFFLSSLL